VNKPLGLAGTNTGEVAEYFFEAVEVVHGYKITHKEINRTSTKRSGLPGGDQTGLVSQAHQLGFELLARTKLS